MVRFDHAAIASSAELELGNVMQLDVAERGIVAAFFEMLKDKSWAHASSADGTDVFKLPGERIHRIMGITRTDATPEQVLTFFSDPHNFDEHFKILDDMFKSGSVVKIGGAREAAALAALAASESEKMLLKKNKDESQPPRDRSGNFPALGLGFGVGKKTVGSDRFGNDQGSHLATDDLGFFQGLGKRIDDAFAKTAGREKRLNDQAAVFAAGLGTKKNEESPSSLAALDALPDATTDATRDALMSDALSATYSSHDASSSGSPFDESFAFGAGASESAADFSKTLAALPIDQNFVDRPGHALLHGTFRLPSLVPDRDFIWDQVAMRLPTGSVLIAGKSVDTFLDDEETPTAKGHVRGAVLTSGYYVAAETKAQGGGSRIAFVVQADPKGNLPAWVVNLVAPKQAHNVTRLRKYLDGN